MKNQLIHGDCLDVLHKLKEQDIQVDLIYLDPPFFSNYTYEIIWGDKMESRSFEDRWAGGIEHYIQWLKERVQAMYDILKPTGSIYLHCDWHANAYIRVEILDKIFGSKNFRNEIVWCYAGGGVPKKDFPRKHDTIFRYTKNNEYIFNVQYREYSEGTKKNPRHSLTGGGEKLDLERGTPLNDWWSDLIKLTSYHTKEWIGYPTQKPEALLERIIKASSNEDDIVLDPFCGGGTTIVVADALNRKWIGVDASAVAINVTEMRLRKQQNKLKGQQIDMLKTAADFVVKFNKFDYDTIRNMDDRKFEYFIIEKYETGSRVNQNKNKNAYAIDGYTAKHGIPIQVKRQDGVGQGVVDNFLSYCKREDKNRCEKLVSKEIPIGVIIAFSFSKSAIEAVAQIKRIEKMEIKLIEVKDIIPLSYKQKINISFKESLEQDKSNYKKIIFEAITQRPCISFAWDFNYNKDNGFQPDIYNDNKNSAEYYFQTKHSADNTYIIACLGIEEDGTQNFETLELKIMI